MGNVFSRDEAERVDGEVRQRVARGELVGLAWRVDDGGGFYTKALRADTDYGAQRLEQFAAFPGYGMPPRLVGVYGAGIEAGRVAEDLLEAGREVDASLRAGDSLDAKKPTGAMG